MQVITYSFLEKISLAKGLDSERIELVMTNLQDQVVHQELLDSSEINGKRLSTQSLGLKAGIYYLKVSNGNVQFTREIIVK